LTKKLAPAAVDDDEEWGCDDEDDCPGHSFKRLMTVTTTIVIMANAITKMTMASFRGVQEDFRDMMATMIDKEVQNLS
jgi:hypothetical protein